MLKTKKKINYPFECVEIVQEDHKLFLTIVPTDDKKILNLTIASAKLGEEKKFYPIRDNFFEIDMSLFLGFTEWEKNYIEESKVQIEQEQTEDFDFQDEKIAEENYQTNDLVLPVIPATKLSVFLDILKENPDKESEEEFIIKRYLFRAKHFKEKKIPNNFKKVEDKINLTSIEPYLTVKGTLSFMKNKEIVYGSQYIRHRHLNQVNVSKHKIKINGNFTTRLVKVKSASILLKLRTQEIEVEENVKIDLLEASSRSLLNRYQFEANFLTSQLMDKLLTKAAKNNGALMNDTMDLFLLVMTDLNEAPLVVRLGKPRMITKLLMNGEAYTNKEESTYMLTPYFTIKYNNLSFHLNILPKKNFVLLRHASHFSSIKHLFNKRLDIWVIGERANTAQDTGYTFFKYIREHHPEKHAYYIIDKNSPDLNKVERLGNIVYFGSEEHVRLIMKANKIISSHHPTYLYPAQTKSMNRSVKGTKVFIQHGVLGVKNLENLYDKFSSSFETDLFMVSSEREKQVVVEDMKYDPEEVKITGLSRFDDLFENDTLVKKQLLISPTWREWITNEEKLSNSQYLNQWLDILNDPRLVNLAQQFEFEIVLNLHNNVQPFIKDFSGNDSIRLVEPGSVRIQDLIKESAILLTDYSSVAFDFSFLNKPVLYYQFDQRKFLGKKGSHLDLENELPGPILFNKEEVFEQIEDYANLQFKMKEEYHLRAKKFLKYEDTNSNKRIYQEIEEFKPQRKSLITRIQDSYLLNSIGKRFRRSHFYFPTMRKIYKLYQWILPIKKNRIVFESGVGKQYSDSPKYIYQEMLKENLDYEYIWFYNGKEKIPGNPKIIKRLSPKYYYYLATSKFWVNNQNFPFYITKRKNQIYIQTWHGTPLKKMLHDVDDFAGKDDGYISRVTQATNQWNYLVSPSHYASKSFRSAFRLKKEILEVGYPRNDIFYLSDDEKAGLAAQVKGKLKLPGDKKIILYAPTFRDNQINEKNKYQFQLELDLQELYENLSDDYILLIRMHVVISNKIKIPKIYNDFVKNVSTYSDIQELYLISDICITDYSSVMFDFANSKKSLLFYAYDLELYRDTLRGFYMDYVDEIPGPILRTTDEIINAVKNIDTLQLSYETKYNDFYDKYCSHETGRAAQTIVQRFF